MSMGDVLQWILDHCDQTYLRGNWAGRGVLPAIEGVDGAAAHWRPHPEQHTIGEIVLHMAYWKDAAGARLAGRPWAYDEQQDWRTVPATDSGWTQAQQDLEAAHKRLMADLGGLTENRLLAPLPKLQGQTRTVRAIDLAIDIATHDHYHAAQIFVLKRLGPAAAERA